MKLSKANEGSRFISPLSGFPLFFVKRSPRIMTNNVWAVLSSFSQSLPKSAVFEALSYIDQAQEFFIAASSPKVKSRPVLYYYSYLNLVKAFLLHKGVQLPSFPKHGLTERDLNLKERYRFNGQQVKLFEKKTKYFNVAAEFIEQMGINVTKEKIFRVSELMSFIPSVHRTWSIRHSAKSKYGFQPRFCPSDFYVYRKGKNFWVRMVVKKNDYEVRRTILDVKGRKSFGKIFKEVKSTIKDERWFETTPEVGIRRGIDNAIYRLAEKVKALNPGYVLTHEGYRFYIPTKEVKPALPQLALSYMIMFYLGSITRYNPWDYSKLLNENTWLISDFLENDPTQFLYGMASLIAERDVVAPVSIERHDT